MLTDYYNILFKNEDSEISSSRPRLYGSEGNFAWKN